MSNWLVVLWSIIALGLGNGIHAKQSFSISSSGPIGYFQDLSNYQTSHFAEWTSKPFPDWVIQYRGGQTWNDGDDDDDNDDRLDDNYDDYEEEDDDETMNKNRDGPTTTDRYDHSMIDPPSAKSLQSTKSSTRPQQQQQLSQGQSFTNGHPNARPNKNQNRQPPSRRRRPKHWTQRIASQGFKVGSQLAWGAVQQTGNVAYQLIKPRHVDPAELLGLWRLDQQISANGVDLASVATIEMDPRQRLLTLKLPNGKTIVESYTIQKTRLGSYQTEFVVPAFLVGDTPRLYGYRGTWQRKLADQRVIKLVGKIYKVKQQRFGKSKGKYTFSQPIGTFVARRRMKLKSDEEEEDEELSDNESAGENDGHEVDGQDNEYDDQEYDTE